MGIDYGDKNIGIAVSDKLQISATGLEVIKRSDPNSFKKPIRRIAEIIEEFEVSSVIIGYPKTMNNLEGERCIKTKDFLTKLQKRFKSIDFVLWDERLSTVIAHRTLSTTSMSQKKISTIIDKVAAVYILQGYLDSLKKKESTI